MKKITVLGAGSWGTALAILLAKNGHSVSMWGYNATEVEQMQQARCNTTYLPNTPFPDNLTVTADFDNACDAADIILIAVPSHAFKSVVEKLIHHHKPLVWVTKGLEIETHEPLHQVVNTVLGDNRKAALLSGPSFAKEVAKGAPTAVVVSSTDHDYAKSIMALFANSHFRPYYSDDLIGVEIGGAIKNVMAIATGIADGLQFGANARAALITRGLHEIMCLGLALGARKDTFMGLSGLGDLTLTCTDDQSRNRRFGLALGKGLSVKDALKEVGQVVEGADNVKQVLQLASDHAIEMPISEHVDKVIDGKMTVQEAVASLFSRALKTE